MARIAGVNVPTNKRLIVALTYIYGIGPKYSKDICEKVKIDGSKRVNSLNEDEIIKIREFIDKYFLVEGDLRREVSVRIKRLTDLGCYRGLRHRKKLPVRGQEHTLTLELEKVKLSLLLGRRKQYN